MSHSGVAFSVRALGKQAQVALLAGVAALGAGCSSSSDDAGGAGGSVARGGAVGSGGAVSSGGSSKGGAVNGNGGTTPAASGGAPSSGGASASGGAANGGRAGDGGLPSSGGRIGNGGAASLSGGRSGSGGAPGNGGATSGGVPATGGSASGGAAASGGSTGVGGAINVGNVSTACPGAVPTGITSTWCSCEQWGEKAVGETTYYNDIWGSGAGPQCIWLTDSGMWGVASKHPNTSGIKSYPNISFSPKKVISSINAYSSSFDVQVPNGGAYEAAYDIWVKGTSSARIEIMLWVTSHGAVQPIAQSYNAQGAAVPDQSNVNVGGHTWNVYYGSNGANDVVSMLRTSNTNSGTIDIKAVLAWIIANNKSKYGVFTNSYTLDQVQFGYEISSDSNTQAYVTKSFSVTSS